MFIVSFMIKLVIKLVLQVLEDSRQILVAANMQPDDPFPMDDKIKEGSAQLLLYFKNPLWCVVHILILSLSPLVSCQPPSFFIFLTFSFDGSVHLSLYLPPFLYLLSFAWFCFLTAPKCPQFVLPPLYFDQLLPFLSPF